MTFSILLHAQSSPIFRLLTSSLQSSQHKAGAHFAPSAGCLSQPKFFLRFCERERIGLLRTSFLPSLRTTKTGGPRRERPACPPACRPPASSHLLASTNALARPLLCSIKCTFISIHPSARLPSKFQRAPFLRRVRLFLD